MAKDCDLGHLGSGLQRLEGRQCVGAELGHADRQLFARVRPVSADVEAQAMEAGGVQESGVR